jgi:hypothetical protein
VMGQQDKEKDMKTRTAKVLDGLAGPVVMMWFSGILIYAGYTHSYGELFLMGVLGLIFPVTVGINEIRDFNRDLSNE